MPQSKSTRCEARRHHFIMTCDIFGNRTNKRDQPTVAPLKSLKSIHSTKLLEKLLTWAAHTFHWRLWWFLWNVCIWEVQCKWNSVQTQSLCPGVHPKKCGLGSIFNIITSWEDLPVTVSFYSKFHSLSTFGIPNK